MKLIEHIVFPPFRLDPANEQLWREQDFALWLSGGMTLHGWALVEEGYEREGIAELQRGIHDWQATGAEIWLPLMRTILAEAHGKAGQPQDGLAVIEEALAVHPSKWGGLVRGGAVSAERRDHAPPVES